MGTWILLSLVSGVALYLSISVNRPLLIAATAVATGLGLLMIVLRILVEKRMRREVGGR